MEKLRKKIRFFAFYTRLFILILQFVCNWVIPDHDAGVFSWPQDPKWKPTILDQLIGFLVDGLIRWDGQHFLHIAQHGYTYETNLAFFPLFPLMIRGGAGLIFWLQEDYMILSYVTAVKLSGIFLSNFLFVFAADALYGLSRKVLKDEYLAYKAGLFFCLNPANIFFSAPYSESLNAFLTFFTLEMILKSFSAKTCASASMASATRANSLLNAGFLVYKSLKIVATETILYIRTKKAKPGSAEISTTLANILGDALVPGLFNLIGCVGSTIVFQYFCFANWCRVTKKHEVDLDEYVVQYGRSNLLKVVGDDPSPWCDGQPPIAYSYIQQAYWGNGFLSYWDVKQLPNFLLAAPCIYVVLNHSYTFFQVHWDFCKRFGLVDNNMLGMPRRPCLEVRQYRLLPRECFVYVVHASFLAIFALFFMHVQVVTRLLLAASPVIPWLAAIYTTRPDKPAIPLTDEKNDEVVYKIECKSNLQSTTDSILFQEKMETDTARWIFTWFLGYTMIGTILFCNNLPWT